MEVWPDLPSLMMPTRAHTDVEKVYTRARKLKHMCKSVLVMQ